MAAFHPKFSVIIPVYNTADYLRECLDSVLKQTIKDLELIVIDDGSTDGCWEIIQEYTAIHSQVKALQQNRKRQGAARNLGLSHARGEFIGFVDSDDKLPLDIYEYMYELAEEHSSDIVVGIQQSFNEKRQWRGVKLHARGLTDELLTSITISDFPELLTDISACNKIFRHKIITDNKVLFPEGCSGEDLYFTARLYLLAQSITVTPRITYYYRGRQNATTLIPGEYLYRGRTQNTFALKKYFQSANLQNIYPVLLRSEVQKLVASRLTKTIRMTPYGERIKILNMISRLTRNLTDEEIVNSGYFSLREQVRIFMLKQEEYECLELFEKKPWSPGYLTFLQKRESYQKISEPLLRIYMREISALNRDRRLNIRVRFPKLLKAYEQVSKPYRRWREALQRKRKANIPFPALLYYFALYPIIWIQSFISNKQIWLIDERLSRSAEDNGFSLFQYLRKQYPKLRIYYVIISDSSDRERVEKLGQVVRQYSFTHAYYLLQAKVLLSTDSLRSLAFPAEIFRRLWGRTHNVFLQHGVMAVKRTVYSQKNFFYLSQIITSSEREKYFFVRDYNFPEDTISVTGLARFDNLTAEKGTEQKRQILVVPTWRIGLNNQQQVETSKYYWAWMQLLTAPELTNLLYQHQASLLFRPHQNMLPFMSDLAIDTDRIRIQKDNPSNLFQLIKESALLITDYSSIMFDFFYQDKPVICYMFDKKEIEYSQGGIPHIDIDTELPAEVHNTAANVISSLVWYLENDFYLQSKQQPKIDNFFKYRDDRNCERIYQAVLHKYSESINTL